ncbi:DNA-3-methyladenine glycosylase [Ehrlichia ruminantium]|uniref:Putative 3-methyladenine DNA glycosylase n=1 Tax=Ehrlichia ruminantium TaxID=779 RepID=A0AAE6QAW3_EHRRU|nr:DNA-3-methyladenine glycosylase [Ehrlichia ruminantium]QGR02777.1 DNA-3-methyladenine glycosylase [Ehrlichia ruminantium]QGR03697.1 DNA-3-methyladenine glycosylase [Ehrlichia ruminantium]QGR04624.1 DNA-3-methyladenine glycosylase [Ehrlichia ruminantium]
MYNILNRSFYEQKSLDVASNLLGKILQFNQHKGIIIETEAYIGQDDPAAHSFRGYTKRTSVMFGKAGFSYVYLIYGMYNCFNVVTEPQGFPAAILIRSIILLSENKPHTIVNGPGKLCKILQITREHNNIDITTNHNFCICDTNLYIDNYICTPRIGISRAKDKFWRFVISDTTYLQHILNTYN